MLGNFIADGLDRTEYGRLTVEIKRGVDHHRRLDTATDAHRSFRYMVSLLRSRHKKYAPVVADILNDHLLCLTWSRHSDLPFIEFEAEVYREFSGLLSALPPKSAQKTKVLLNHQYLKAYWSREGLGEVLRRMDKRAKFPSRFSQAAEDLYERLDDFTPPFLDLFEDLKLIKP